MLVADKLCLAHTSQDLFIERGRHGNLRKGGLLATAAAFALFGKGALETGTINGDTALSGEFNGEIDREAVGVMQLEGDLATEGRTCGWQIIGATANDALPCAEFGERIAEQARTGIERACELRLFALDPFKDRRLSIAQVWVGGAHDRDNFARNRTEKRLGDAEESCMAHRAADDAAQDVATPLIPRSHPVGEQEGDGARVIGNHLIAEALRVKLGHRVLRDLAHRRVDRQEEVGVVVGEHLLRDAGEALQAHAGIDALEREFGASAIRVLLVLHEDEIPHLEPTRAVLRVVWETVGAAREICATIEVNLGAGAAWARLRHAPEVRIVPLVNVAPACQSIGGNADLLQPDVGRLVVIAVDRNGEAIGRDPDLDGEELPGPEDRIALEVVPERPGAEHLKEGVVSWRSANLLKVIVLPGNTKAALVVDGAAIRAGLGATEELFELHHPRVREEEGGVASGDERGARHLGVSARLKERHEPSPKVGGALRWDSRIAFHARSVPEGILALGSLPSLPIGRNPRGEPLAEERTDERGWPRRAAHGVEPAQQALRRHLQHQGANDRTEEPDREGCTRGEKPPSEQCHPDREGDEERRRLNHAERCGRAMRAPATSVSPS